jgi:predicted nucleic-acid-binding Zn-ribbon protein
MTVAEGENSTPSLNNTVSLDNVIDAETASSVETHTQSTHVWHTGEQLELLFDLQQEYSITTVHFWNYFTEFYDVDTVELTFVDSSNAQTASITINPEMGTPNPVESEDIDLDENLSSPGL